MGLHVFVETNFVVEWAAPAHLRAPAAIALVDRASRGELTLHIPAICLSEARPVLRSERYKPRHNTDPIRTFLRATASLSSHRDSTFRVLDAYDKYIQAELSEVSSRVDELKVAPGVHVFAADDGILERSLSLTSYVRLKLYDLAILASILVRAERIQSQEPDAVLAFCELDGDLQPWGGRGETRADLTALYDAARVWVYGDFTMQKPAPPDGWR